MALGFGKKFGQLLKDLDLVATSVFSAGPTNAATRIVRDLQDAGPSWTGEFSNSWQIQGPSNTVSGTGQPGEPRRLTAILLTGKELLSKPEIKYSIGNFAEHANIARDLEPRNGWIRPGGEPQTQKGLRAWAQSDKGRANPSLRGEIGGGSAEGESSRTAPLDWFSSYINGGQFNKAIQIEMDRVMKDLPK